MKPWGVWTLREGGGAPAPWVRLCLAWPCCLLAGAGCEKQKAGLLWRTAFGGDSQLFLIPCLLTSLSLPSLSVCRRLISKGKADQDSHGSPLAAAQALGATLDAQLSPAHGPLWSSPLILFFLLFPVRIIAADPETRAENFLIKKETRGATLHGLV